MSACQRSPSIFTRGWRSEVLGEAQSAVLAAPLAPPEAARVGPVRHRCHLLDERFGSSHLSPGMVCAGATLVTLGVLVATGVAAIRSSEKPTAMPSETDRPLAGRSRGWGGPFPVCRFQSPERIGHSRRPTPRPGRWRAHPAFTPAIHPGTESSHARIWADVIDAADSKPGGAHQAVVS